MPKTQANHIHKIKVLKALTLGSVLFKQSRFII